MSSLALYKFSESNLVIVLKNCVGLKKKKQKKNKQKRLIEKRVSEWNITKISFRGGRLGKHELATDIKQNSLPGVHHVMKMA